MLGNIRPVCRAEADGFVVPALPTNTLCLKIISLYERTFRIGKEHQVALFMVSAIRVVVYTVALAASLFQDQQNFVRSLMVQCIVQSFLHPCTPFIVQAPENKDQVQENGIDPFYVEDLAPIENAGLTAPLQEDQWPMNAPYYALIAPRIRAAILEAGRDLEFNGQTDPEKLLPYYTFAHNFLEDLIEELKGSGQLTLAEEESLEEIDFSMMVIPGQVAQLLEAQRNARFTDRLNLARTNEIRELRKQLTPENSVPILLAILFSKKLDDPQLQDLKKRISDLGQIFYQGDHWNAIHGIERVRHEEGMNDIPPDPDLIR